MEQQQQQHSALLDWTKKQGRILTGGGRAEEYYTAERGFPFGAIELPHHYLLDEVFCNGKNADEDAETWQQQQQQQYYTDYLSTVERRGQATSHQQSSILTGAWKRTLFYGGWEHSTDHDEHTFNLQTNTLFVDLRIPCARRRALLLTSSSSGVVSSLDDLTPEQLRIYARQHVFAGYTRHCSSNSNHSDDNNDSNNHPQDDDPNKSRINKSSRYLFRDGCCTRHHCIDWNFVGVGRTRPNKWWIETAKNDKDVWKEWAYATDEHGQHYYCEQWERWEGGGSSPVVALRKKKKRASSC